MPTSDNLNGGIEYKKDVGLNAPGNARKIDVIVAGRRAQTYISGQGDLPRSQNLTASSPTSPPRQLAVLKNYRDLLATIKARRDELNVPHEIVDVIAGLASGHTSKVLAEMKLIGPISWNLLEALGMRVIVVEDKTALARAQRSSAWRTRRQNQPLPVHQYPQAK